MNEEIIKNLKSKQDQLESLKVNLTTKKEEFEKTNAGLIEEIRIMSEGCEESKREIKIEAIAEFQQTGEKKMFGGIGIRVLNKLFYDESNAIQWAKQNMPVAIVEIIDKKQFETYAKTNELEFVKKEESISVTFPKEIKF